ncbi:MAG: D-cysteine desulfhydrase [Deltaproteobacteria bacterium]|nr:D-cysteine desulfhydrase [Deltaproteobacteria bacterium]
MDLTRFPRRRYTEGYTPIEKLQRFTEALGGPEIYIKRDDLLGLTGGGNKTRKLEFVVADALVGGYDTLITCGAIQSNHCRLTLSAAVKEGLYCRLVIEERVPGTYDPRASGNNFLYRLLDAETIKVMPSGIDEVAEMEKMADEARADGRKPYIIDGSSASALSALGYVACAQELTAQLFEKELHIDHIVCPSGSGGTHGGLLAGLWGTNTAIPVVGINVRRSRELQEPKVYDVVQRTARFLGIATPIPEDIVICFDDYYKPGYSIPNDMMIEAVRLLARTEGILVDPVYTGKAMAGLIGLVRSGYFKKSDKILFLHTGGSPALYAYIDTFLSE